MVSTRTLLINLAISFTASIILDLIRPPVPTIRITRDQIRYPHEVDTTTTDEMLTDETVDTAAECDATDKVVTTEEAPKPVQIKPTREITDLRRAVVRIIEFLCRDSAEEVLMERYDPLRDAMVHLTEYAAGKKPVDIVTVADTLLEIELAFPDETELINLLRSTQVEFGVPNVGDVLPLQDILRDMLRKDMSTMEVRGQEDIFIITGIPEEVRVKDESEFTKLFAPPTERDNRDIDTSLDVSPGEDKFAAIKSSPSEGLVGIPTDELHALYVRDSVRLFNQLEQCVGDNFAEEVAAVMASISWAPPELKQAFVDLSLEITNARDKTRQAYRKPKRSR